MKLALYISIISLFTFELSAQKKFAQLDLELPTPNEFHNAAGETNKQQHPQQQINESVSNSNLKNIIRETMEDVLKENGLLIESETSSNDLFKFRVGEHIFEGKILKVKKVSK